MTAKNGTKAMMRMILMGEGQFEARYLFRAGGLVCTGSVGLDC